MTKLNPEHGLLRCVGAPPLRVHSLKFARVPEKNYTVLLLYPEYLTKQYGIDTILLWVTANDPSIALWKGQLEAVDAQLLPVMDPKDFTRLGVFEGHIEDAGT